MTDLLVHSPPHFHIALRTLGVAALQQTGADGRVSTVLESSKLLALLVYLNKVPGRSATRDHLVNLLWSDLDEAAGQHSLRHHLWLLKQRLGESVHIDRSGETLTLRDPLPSDDGALRAAASAGDLVQVVSLYRGEFFPDFASRGAHEFELWVERERSTLRSIFLHSGQLVVREWLDAGRPRDAAALARRLRDTDPLNQAAWRLVLETLVACRDLVGAAVEAEALTRSLASEELDAEPSTQAVIEAIRRPGLSPKAVTGTHSLSSRELVGRESEFSQLIRRWGDAVRGRTQTVHVVGEAGIGKTRLLQEFGARIRSMRRDVVEVRAHWSGRSVPWAVLSDVAAEVCRLPGAIGVSPRSAAVLVSMAPSASEVFSGTGAAANIVADAAARRSAVRELLVVVAETRPLALLVDDIHWCDEHSRDALFSAVEGIDKAKLLVVLTQRPDPAVVVPSRFAAIPLAPLSRQGVTTLVASIADLPEAPWAEPFTIQLCECTGGSPLNVLSLLQLATQRGALEIVADTWRVGDAQTFQELLAGGEVEAARLAILSEPQRSLVEYIAVAGHPLSEDTARELSGASEGMLGQLEQLGILVRATGGVNLAHDAIAEAVRRTMDDATRKSRSLDLGARLAARASSIVSFRDAAHLLRAGEDESAVARLFAEYVRWARKHRNHSRASALAQELLPGASAEERRRLVGGLGVVARTGLDLPARQWGLAAVCTLGAFAVFLLAWAQGAVVGVPLYLTYLDDREQLTVARYLLPDDWRARGKRLQLKESGSPLRVMVTGVERILSPPADSLPFLLVRQVDDTRLTDLFLYDVSGRLRNLTDSPGDDTDPDWSGDGSMIAFSTARWSRDGQRDVAVLHLASGVTSRLTSAPANEREVKWSPDGTRVAYLRSGSSEASAACVVTIDGRDTSCHSLAWPDASLIGWASDTSVFIVGSEGKRALHVLDVENGSVARMVDLPGGVQRVDDEGLLVCVCYGSGDAPSWRLYDAGARDFTIDLQLAIPKGVRQQALEGTRRSRWLLGEQRQPSIDLSSGVPHVAPPRWRRADGSVLVGGPAQWVSPDSTMVRVTDRGELVGLREGRLVLSASAGGWRSTRMEVTVRPASTVSLLDEDWSRVPEGWRLFGTPSPVIVRPDGQEAVVSNSGDGTYNSGAYSVREFSAAGGIALKARLAGKVDAPKWQVQRVELTAAYDSAVLSRWDHRTGYLWSDGRTRRAGAPTCAFQYPGGSEGSSASDWVHAAGELIPSRGLSLGSGRWFDLILQWLPDGRCAVLLDGHLVALTDQPGSVPAVRALWYGNAVGTSMLLGPVSVIRGTLPEVIAELNRPQSARPLPARSSR